MDLIPQHTLQHLMLQRFGMSLATYAMATLLFWVGLFSGLFISSISTALLLTGSVILTQLAFLGIFLSGQNLRCRDPSLTEAQMLVALVWLTVLLGMYSNGRGALLVIYVLIMMFGIFQLPPRVFARCAAIAFFGFAGLNLFEAYQHLLADPPLAILQVSVLGGVMIWLSLFASYVQAIRRRMHEYEKLAGTDELTGLFNRRHFLRFANRERRNLSAGSQHGLAMIDLDHFKRVNDVHGHAAGDRVLQTFATVAKACLRDGDILARYGGEEFVLLMLNTQTDQFTACCERLREAFNQAQPLGTKMEILSLSIGMTLLTMQDDLDEALQRSDQALYRAKNSGRNRCTAAWEEADAPNDVC